MQFSFCQHEPCLFCDPSLEGGSQVYLELQHLVELGLLRALLGSTTTLGCRPNRNKSIRPYVWQDKCPKSLRIMRINMLADLKNQFVAECSHYLSSASTSLQYCVSAKSVFWVAGTVKDDLVG
eukprot:2383485-Amphidinium_carterae.1